MQFISFKFHLIPFHSIQSHAIQIDSIQLNSIPLRSIPFHSNSIQMQFKFNSNSIRIPFSSNSNSIQILMVKSIQIPFKIPFKSKANSKRIPAKFPFKSHHPFQFNSNLIRSSQIPRKFRKVYSIQTPFKFLSSSIQIQIKFYLIPFNAMRFHSDSIQILLNFHSNWNQIQFKFLVNSLKIQAWKNQTWKQNCFFQDCFFRRRNASERCGGTCGRRTKTHLKLN